ncbi:MAG: hypothetical protein V1839_01700 [archaeon]
MLRLIRNLNKKSFLEAIKLGEFSVQYVHHGEISAEDKEKDLSVENIEKLLSDETQRRFFRIGVKAKTKGNRPYEFFIEYDQKPERSYFEVRAYLISDNKLDEAEINDALEKNL